MLFLDKEEQCHLRGFEEENSASLEMFFNEFFAGLIFDGVKRVGLGLFRTEQVLEFDDVVLWLGGW